MEEKEKIKKISSTLNVDSEVLEKFKCVFSISGVSKLTGINADALYAAARKNKFPTLTNTKLRSKIIDVSDEKFLEWFRNYSPNKPEKMECRLPDCTNKVRRNSGKYCCQEHYVKHRKIDGEFKKMGHVGTYGKGLGERDKSPKAQEKRSRAASLGKLSVPERTLMKKA